jgi:hypothetical protein
MTSLFVIVDSSLVKMVPNALLERTPLDWTPIHVSAPVVGLEISVRNLMSVSLTLAKMMEFAFSIMEPEVASVTMIISAWIVSRISCLPDSLILRLEWMK